MPTEEKIIDITMLGYYHQQVNPANKDDLDDLSDRVDEIISEGGEPNVIETIRVNGSTLIPINKAVDIEVPTNTSDLTNDSDFQSELEVQALIDASLEGITEIDFQVVDNLPLIGEHGVIYLKHREGATGDIYDEYIWVTPEVGSAHYEQIGTTAIDLSDYWDKATYTIATASDIDEILNAE